MKKLDLLARIISFLTNPLFVLFPVPYLLIFHLGYSQVYALKWTLFSFLFNIIAGIFVLYEVKHKVFSDMDVSKREQRPLLFIMTGAITGVYLVSLLIFRAPAVLFIVVWGAIVGILLASAVNLRIKASLHVAVLTSVLLTLSLLYQYSFLFFMLIPIVGWARIRIRRHSFQEVIAGGMLGVTLYIFMFILLRYIYILKV